MKSRRALQLPELVAYFHGAQRALEATSPADGAIADGERTKTGLERVRHYRAALEETRAMPPAEPSGAGQAQDPIELLADWLEQARATGVPGATAMTLCTVSAQGRPSARTVDLKRLEPDALLFTTALWTRKARELSANEHVAALFHWPQLGRQVHVVGAARETDRQLSEELFDSREILHRMQTLVSRQGEVITDLEPLRARLRQLRENDQPDLSCPADWGAFRLLPSAIEFWQRSPDRLHDRLLFECEAGAWRRSRLAP